MANSLVTVKVSSAPQIWIIIQLIQEIFLWIYVIYFKKL